jgi:3',5'-cyclic AMP phosphodiesterase CpdA
MNSINRRAFLGIAAGAALSSCARVNPKRIIPRVGGPGSMTFATVSDMHLTDSVSASMLNRAVSAINAGKQVQFVAGLGDFADAGRYEELRLAKHALDRIEKPYYIVPGNHDLNPTLADPYQNFNRVFAWNNWDQQIGGWRFFGIDSNAGDGIEVTIPEEQLGWLRERLGESSQQPIGLFLHHPLNPNSKLYRVVNAEEVLAIFAGHNLRLVASGHYHGNQVETRDGVLFTTTAPCSPSVRTFDDSNERGYRIYRIEGETIETVFVPMTV